LAVLTVAICGRSTGALDDNEVGHRGRPAEVGSRLIFERVITGERRLVAFELDDYVTLTGGPFDLAELFAACEEAGAVLGKASASRLTYCLYVSGSATVV
jgi:hypothetical protein